MAYRRNVVVAALLVTILATVTPVPADEPVPVPVQGEVVIGAGRLPAGAQVRATPVEGGEPVTVPIHDLAFTFPALAPGLYRFEILLANNTVFAEAGAVDARIGPGAETLTLVIQEGRTDPPSRSAGDWVARHKVLVIVGGALLVAAGVCLANDCLDDDDSVSPVTP